MFFCGGAYLRPSVLVFLFLCCGATSRSKFLHQLTQVLHKCITWPGDGLLHHQELGDDPRQVAIKEYGPARREGVLGVI